MSDKPTIGYLGVGLMGEPMVNRLLDAGFEVTVWNRTKSKLDKVIAKGAIAADTPAELAARCDYVFMCLMDAASIETVVFGENGVCRSDNPKILVDFGTIHPDTCRDFAARLRAQNGTTWVDAPISGGVAGAADGTLAIMAGGSRADIDTLRPVIAHLSARFTHMGENGAGLLTKLCNQIIVGSTMAVIAEAVNFATKSGVDAGALTHALKGGFADSLPFQLFAPRMVAGDFDNPLGATDTMIKDQLAISDVAASVGAKIPMTDQALKILKNASDHGDGQRDISSIIKVFDRSE
ncbi:MAG: 2-hydroxy-3-oxopropionate reductase [Rhodobacteraceae bacterium]|nr:MAG: 2-hydroxy-3-oxopropionate reductase [Paracoccaceae bacterium]